MDENENKVEGEEKVETPEVETPSASEPMPDSEVGEATGTDTPLEE
jgi:hypothetical protein